MQEKNIYLSLDEARSVLKQRFGDVSLKQKIMNTLGDKRIPYFGETPLAVSFRQLVSADNGLAFFCHCSRYISAQPIVMEYLDDKFVSFNEEKKGLGRLRITLPNSEKATVDIMNFHEQENKTLKELVTFSGISLVDFHHELVQLEGVEVDIYDTSTWFKNIGRASDYYYYKFLHYVAHGVLFEFFDEEGTHEGKFTHSVIYPAIRRVQEEFGVTPMIVRSYPEDQNDVDDFYWWDHSRLVNNHIINYANKYNLAIRLRNFM